MNKCETCRFLAANNSCENQRRNTQFKGLTGKPCKFYQDEHGSGPWEDRWLSVTAVNGLLVIAFIIIGLLCN